MKILRCSKALGFRENFPIKQQKPAPSTLYNGFFFQLFRYHSQEIKPSSERQRISLDQPEEVHSDSNRSWILKFSENSIISTHISTEDELLAKTTLLNKLQDESTILSDLEKLKILENYIQFKHLRKGSKFLRESEKERKTILHFLNSIPTSLITASFENYLKFFSVIGFYSNLWLKIDFIKRKELLSAFLRFQNEIDKVSLEKLFRLSCGFKTAASYDIRLFRLRDHYLPVLLKLLDNRKSLSFTFQSRAGFHNQLINQLSSLRTTFSDLNPTQKQEILEIVEEDWSHFFERGSVLVSLGRLGFRHHMFRAGFWEKVIVRDIAAEIPELPLAKLRVYLHGFGVLDYHWSKMDATTQERITERSNQRFLSSEREEGLTEEELIVWLRAWTHVRYDWQDNVSLKAAVFASIASFYPSERPTSFQAPSLFQALTGREEGFFRQTLPPPLQQTVLSAIEGYLERLFLKDRQGESSLLTILTGLSRSGLVIQDLSSGFRRSLDRVIISELKRPGAMSSLQLTLLPSCFVELRCSWNDLNPKVRSQLTEQIRSGLSKLSREETSDLFTSLLLLCFDLDPKDLASILPLHRDVLQRHSHFTASTAIYREWLSTTPSSFRTVLSQSVSSLSAPLSEAGESGGLDCASDRLVSELRGRMAKEATLTCSFPYYGLSSKIFPMIAIVEKKGEQIRLLVHVISQSKGEEDGRTSRMVQLQEHLYFKKHPSVPIIRIYRQSLEKEDQVREIGVVLAEVIAHLPR